MKPIVQFVVAALLAGTLAGTALAQKAGPAGGLGQVSPVVKAQNGKGAKKKELLTKLSQNQRKAYKQMNGALTLMERALPIYGGHRVLAVDLVKTARQDLVLGANDQAAKAKKKNKKAQVQEGSDKSGYPKEKVEISQRELSKAVEEIGKAIETLSSETSSYVQESVANLKRAQDELKTAIALHGNP